MFYFICIFGIFWTVIMFCIVIMGQRSKTWPLTTGKIITSEVCRRASRPRPGHANPPSYEPYVVYEYYVNGNRMQSDQLAFGGRLQNSEKRAQKIIENYPAGKNVPVYYNPKKPAQAVLVTGNVAGAYIMLVIGFIFIALGVTGITLKW